MLFVIYYCRATHIYTTQAYVRNDTNGLSLMDVMFVGTNEGKILKIVMTYNGTHHVPLVSEELSVSFPWTLSCVCLHAYVHTCVCL